MHTGSGVLLRIHGKRFNGGGGAAALDRDAGTSAHEPELLAVARAAALDRDAGAEGKLCENTGVLTGTSAMVTSTGEWLWALSGVPWLATGLKLATDLKLS